MVYPDEDVREKSRRTTDPEFDRSEDGEPQSGRVVLLCRSLWRLGQ